METHLLSNWPELEKTLSLSQWPEQWSQQIRQIFWPYGLSIFIHKSAKESVSIYFYIGKNVSFLVNPRKGDNRYWGKLDNFGGNKFGTKLENIDRNTFTFTMTGALPIWQCPEQ